MTRDDLILYFVPIVSNIVKKFNNHEDDEDMQSVGMIKCIKAVDRCLDLGMSDPEEMKPMVITYAKNEILDYLKTEKRYRNSEDTDDFDFTDDSELDILKFEIRESLTGKTLEMYDLKIAGYTEEEICEKLNIGRSQYFEYLKRIKNLIIGRNQTF